MYLRSRDAQRIMCLRRPSNIFFFLSVSPTCLAVCLSLVAFFLSRIHHHRDDDGCGGDVDVLDFFLFFIGINSSTSRHKKKTLCWSLNRWSLWAYFVCASFFLRLRLSLNATSRVESANAYVKIVVKIRINMKTARFVHLRAMHRFMKYILLFGMRFCAFQHILQLCTNTHTMSGICKRQTQARIVIEERIECGAMTKSGSNEIGKSETTNEWKKKKTALQNDNGAAISRRLYEKCRSARN